MNETLASRLGAYSLWGPTLCGLGFLGLVMAYWVHGLAGKPTLFRKNLEANSGELSPWERLSVHLISYDAWALAFGAVIWLGPVENYMDTHLRWERNLPVYPAGEWIYLSVYFVPLFMPWIAPDRATLLRYAQHFGWISAISVAFYLTLPFGCPPRPFTSDSLSGRLLAWETQRGDFAAAALPSFHVIWALLCAELLAAKGRIWATAASAWAAAVMISCIATGAHALLDVLASVAIFIGVARGLPVSPRATRAESIEVG